MDPVFGTKVSIMKEDLTDKEKILERQKRLSEQKDFLKDKLKKVAERKAHSNTNSTLVKKNDINSNHASFSTPPNKEKQSASAQPKNIELPSKSSASILKSQHKFQSSTNTSIHNQLKKLPVIEEPIPSTSKFRTKVESSVCDDIHRLLSPTTASKDNPKFQPAPANIPPTTIKHSKPVNNQSKKNKSPDEPKQEKRSSNSDKKILKKKSRHGIDGKFYSTTGMNDYLKHNGRKHFLLPPSEYKELLKIKSSDTTRSSPSKLLDEEQIERERKKCFYQITPSIEDREDDGPITDCYIDKKNLILIQRDAINVYSRTDKRSKEWIFQDTMKKLRFNEILKESIISCNFNNKESLVFCQIHLTTDEENRKKFIKMAQYRFQEEKGKVMKEYVLGSFDCSLEKLRCCHIAKRPCCFAVTGWNVARIRTIGWVFTHSEVNDIMRCGAMIPVKHEVESLHDISLTPHRNVLLAFGGRIFTIWNAKTGERLVNCTLDRLSPTHNITCHFGCFATIQKGFLFILANTEDKLHMIATNLDTEVSKSLRKFKIPKDNKCLAVGVKDDKLVGITDKSIICWSLKTTLRIQHLRLDEDDKPFLFKSKILIVSDSRLKKLLTIRSDADYRQEMASKMKELMNSTSAENEALKKKISANYKAMKNMNK